MNTVLKISDIVPAKMLKELFESKGITVPIFINQDRPTSKLPDEFIDIQLNGAPRRQMTSRELYHAIVAVGINVRLLSTGNINATKIDLILRSIEDIIDESDIFSTTIINTVYDGKSIIAGYSSKIININCRIFKQKQ